LVPSSLFFFFFFFKKNKIKKTKIKITINREKKKKNAMLRELFGAKAIFEGNHLKTFNFFKEENFAEIFEISLKDRSKNLSLSK